MKKLNLLILPAFFFGLIFFFFFNQIGQWITFKQNSENRNFNKMPALNINKLDNFPKEYDAYLNDNFTFRTPFMNVYHELKYQFHISPDPAKALIGTDGQLFLSMHDQDVYNGTRNFGPPQLDSMTRIWDEKQDYFKKKNIPFYWLVAPVKHHVYAENLPLNIVERYGNRTLKLTRHFASRHPDLILYPLHKFRKEKKKQQLFFKLDNHWNLKGGYLAYKELMKKIKADDPGLQIIEENEFRWKDSIQFRGSLSDFIGKNEELADYIPLVKFKDPGAIAAPAFGFLPTPDFPYPNEYELHFFGTKAKNKKRVLVIRDSFGDALIPFLTESFSETLFIFDSWHYSINKQIVDTYKPDLVIFITMESLVDNILDNPAIIEAEKAK